jgi:transposase
MFVMRLMHSGRDFAWLYPRQDQTCFLDGHVRAFAHFGAAPHRIAYDNLKAAVTKILVGSERQLAPRFLSLATHYLFESSFARPRTGHDRVVSKREAKGFGGKSLFRFRRDQSRLLRDVTRPFGNAFVMPDWVSFGTAESHGGQLQQLATTPHCV